VQITRLRLFHYRNIGQLEIFPSAGTSLFSGRNGQGKTNLLESIYLLAYGKSFRTSTPRDCIQHGQAECRIEGTVSHGELQRDLQVVITNGEKRLFLFDKSVSLDDFVGNLHLLAFTHEHLNVVRGGPADRRAFLDRAMVTLYPGHVSHLTAYGRALRQKNKILASARDGKGRIEHNLLDSWDEAIADPGARIVENRLRYVERMKENLPQGLFGAEELKMHYFPSVGANEVSVQSIEENFRERLLQTREMDKKNGHTSVGPHRDDLKLYVNGKSLVSFGSAGQQRSGLLSLYFSQMEIHRKFHGFYPVFLMDDAEAELDEQRLNTFIHYLLQRTQIFLTSSKQFLLSALPENTCHFKVQNGNIFPPA
jgi:DNA replication and repair protein RecF